MPLAEHDASIDEYTEDVVDASLARCPMSERRDSAPRQRLIELGQHGEHRAVHAG